MVSDLVRRASEREGWTCARDLVFRHADLWRFDGMGLARAVVVALDGDAAAIEVTDSYYGILGDKHARLFHAVIHDDIAWRIGTTFDRMAFVVELRTTAESLNGATDAILVCAAAAGLELDARVDAPREPHWMLPPSAHAVRALEHVDSNAFARFLVCLVPSWFDFDPSTFQVRRDQWSVDITVTNPVSMDRIEIHTASSRNLACVVHAGGREHHGILNMHYQPSSAQLARARVTLAFAFHRLFPDRAFPEELARAIPTGGVFPDDLTSDDIGGWRTGR